MKSNNTRTVSKRTLLIKFFGKIILFCVIYFFILFFPYSFLEIYILQVPYYLYDAIFGSIFIPLSRFEFALFVGIMGIIIVCIIEVNRYASSISKLSVSLRTLLDDDSSIENYPSYFKDIELSLNELKYTVFKNEQLAREAEQRKNDLVVYLAHDLKTPLTSIIGYLTLLDEIPELPMEQRAKYTKITLDKAYRLEQLINEFFDITRFNLQTVMLENNRLDLKLMLNQMADEFYPLLTDKNLNISLHIPKNINTIGDSDKLARVFDNLLRNAVNYSYENSTIEIFAEQVDKTAVIRFRNCGDQIPQEKLSHIFEKFFRLDSSRGTGAGGAGLGLAIAKQIIELHNGSIFAESNTDYTEFTVVLPVSDSRFIITHRQP